MAAILFDVTDPIVSPDLFNIHKYCIRVTFTINATTYIRQALSFIVHSTERFRTPLGLNETLLKVKTNNCPRQDSFTQLTKLSW